MKLSSRLLRRVIIATVFLAVFFLFGYGTRQLTQTPPSCTDGIKNGEEEGADCGLFACGNYCEPDLDPPKVISTQLIEAGEGDYDFVAVIENPHPKFGASEVVYELTLFNGNENKLSKTEGMFYILPGQTKYFVLTHLRTDKNVQKIDFKIKSAKWQKLDSLEGLNLIVRNEKYTNLGRSAGSALDAIIFNDSDFDFDRIDIDVVLLNSSGKIIAVHKSDIRTFLARTERGFLVVWPFRIDGRVDRTEIYPSTNLFENSNFIKKYGSSIEKFQEYE